MDDLGIRILTLSQSGDCSALEAQFALVKESLGANCGDVLRGDSSLAHTLKKSFTCAARCGHTDCVRAFVTNLGLDVNSLCVSGRTALHNAAESNMAETVRCLVVELKADVNARAIYNRHKTSLHLAASMGHVQAMEALLSSSALCELDVNVRCTSGATPLFLAAEAGKIEAVRWLLGQKGIQLSLANVEGVTALHTASSRPRCSSIVEALLQKIEEGAVDVDARTRATKKTPLHDAVFSDLETVRLLVSYGADVNAVDSEGNTALHCATLVGWLPDIVQYLVEDAGADVSVRNARGQTPLYIAADLRHSDVIKVLVENRGVF